MDPSDSKDTSLFPVHPQNRVSLAAKATSRKHRLAYSRALPIDESAGVEGGWVDEDIVEVEIAVGEEDGA
ncbi:hypothetical protein BHYA_0095g00310 [Botrytis hyacinthi]|uniref:Uncharacterized protein n=1 Tax=Botrytis hyacinthi TaxID=278943 RepID=A0A4Z1GMG4_9HELO|nr:hypothetical protein BHYA_0095g00310 [Botrytis hyacinthi]